MTYQEANQLFKTARNKRLGKPLENNTRLFQRGSDYAVQLHCTDVVIIHPNDTVTLESGGWRTVTTKDRINTYSPARVAQEQGIWYVYVEGPFTRRFLYSDGMTVDSSGVPIGPTSDPKPLEKAKRRNKCKTSDAPSAASSSRCLP